MNLWVPINLPIRFLHFGNDEARMIPEGTLFVRASSDIGATRCVLPR
jgi:hypothetical protein